MVHHVYIYIYVDWRACDSLYESSLQEKARLNRARFLTGHFERNLKESEGVLTEIGVLESLDFSVQLYLLVVFVITCTRRRDKLDN